MALRWSIQTKILVVLSALLICVVAAYLVLAQRIFRQDKELLVFDTNRSGTEQLASELDGSIRRLIDKMDLLAQLVASPAQGSQSLAAGLFEQDAELLAFQLVDPDRREHPLLRELVSERKLAGAGVSRSQALSPDRLPQSPLKGSLTLTIENVSSRSAILFLLRVPVMHPGGPSTGRRLFAQALVDGHAWLDSFKQGRNLALSFAVTPSGRVFAHPNAEWVLERRDLSALEPVRAALHGDFMVQQMEFPWEGKRYLGIYRKTPIGSLIVVSMTDRAEMLSAINVLLEKTALLSLVIVTVVFLVSLFFASSLSTPLLRLVRATNDIAQGKFDAPLEVHTGDEIGILADSFARMGRELKSSRELLESYNAELERKVQERTSELEAKNAAIRQQQEVLLRTTRLAAVGEIAGQAAHEVLNPLTAMISRLETVAERLRGFSDATDGPVHTFKAIVVDWKKERERAGTDGWLQSLKQPSRAMPGLTLGEEDLANLEAISAQFDALGQKLAEDLGLMTRESHRISRIVDGMRGLSRSTKIRSRVDVTALVSECVKVSEDLLARNGIRIETRFERKPIHVFLDADEMRQVFSNMIRNSMDAIGESGRGDGRVVIAAGLRDAETVRITVWDNGAGIAPSDRDRLFDSDFSTKGSEGTGFGLSICRRFVRGAGGELAIGGSVPGNFTEFEMTLPIAPEEA